MDWVAFSPHFCIGQFLFNHTEEGGNVVMPYTILGILVLVIALVFSRVDLPEISHVATAEDEAAGSNISKLFFPSQDVRVWTSGFAEL